MSAAAALLFAALALGVAGFQIALILGAPWGRLTQGGQHPGALPPRNRVLAGLSVLLLAIMALSLTGAAGLGPDSLAWAGWEATGLTALSLLATLATRSRPERRLWAPVTALMLALALTVMLARP